MLNNFELELSNFSYVNTAKGLTLRCTLVWRLECEHGILGMKLDGCLVQRLISGELSFRLPGYGGNNSRSRVSRTWTQGSVDLHDMCIKLVKTVNDGRWAAKIGYREHKWSYGL